jgi:tetratricopeptide (TPR) repeat protein
LDVLPEAEAIRFLLTLCARIGDVAAEIAKLCGYLPLALRIAGTFLAVHEDWSPEEYASRLSDRRERLKTLRDPEDPALDLEAAFELSYQQLTTSDTPPSLAGKGVGGLGQAAAWRALAVFPASFRCEAAAAVWELEETLARELLSKLHRMSLLDYLEPSPPEGGIGQGEGGGRYSLHDLLADFALARMNEEETFVARLRHSQHYMNVMGQADALYLKGGESILQGLKSFDDEWAHIQAGQAWAAENTKKGSETSELAMLYPDAGAYCLALRLTPQQRISWLMAALEAARALGKKSMEGNHLGNLRIAYKDLGEARKAIEYHEQALAIDREIGDRRGEGTGLGNLGSAYYSLGDARKAIQFYEQALVIDREIGDRRGEALGSCNLGLAYEQLGDLAKAIKAMQVCVDFEREIGHPDAEKDAAKVAELKQKL